MSFSSLGLSEPLLRAIDTLDYSTPTPIQLQAIPAVLTGKDIMAAAQTGTGKTASFALPLLQRLSSGSRVKANHIRVLVLTPTRELAMQVGESIATYGRYLPLKSTVVYGGVKINPQMMKLRGGIDILVATPGRLLDLFSQNAVKFSQLESLVLDEADKMLDLGFSDDIRKILAFLPKKRQNLLFSATFSSDIRKLTRGLLKNPVQIEVSPRNTAARSVKQWIYEVDKNRKPALLSHLVRHNHWQQVLVFSRTKKGADQLVTRLKRDGISAAAIHGDKSQAQRSRVLAEFKANTIRVLVATDIAARGIDINELPHVINFDLPKVAGDYIHRIGRTGRAGLQGEGISLVSADEIKLLYAIETLIRRILARKVETGFVPVHAVPLSRQLKKAKKPKKPKKPRQKQGEELDNVSNKSRRGSRSQEAGNQKRAAAGRGRKRRDRNAVSLKKNGSSKPGRVLRTRNKAD